MLKIRASLFLLTLLILAITTLCVTSNFSEMVIERSKEIGILKALGGAERRIAAFFVSESAVLALAATLAGYAAGVFAAAAHRARSLRRRVPPASRLARLRRRRGRYAGRGGHCHRNCRSRIWSIQPAIILRGE